MDTRYTSASRILALVALILCLLQAFSVHMGSLQVGWLGLAFLAAAFVV